MVAWHADAKECAKLNMRIGLPNNTNREARMTYEIRKTVELRDRSYP